MRRLILLATIDARRPAAWLALVVAVVGAALLSAAPRDGCPTPAVIAAVVGAGLAVAAIGDTTRRANAADIDAARVAERAAWPLVGWLLGLLVAAGGLGDALLAATGPLGIMAGGGLEVGAIAALRAVGVREFHASCRSPVPKACVDARLIEVRDQHGHLELAHEQQCELAGHEARADDAHLRDLLRERLVGRTDGTLRPLLHQVERVHGRRELIARHE